VKENQALGELAAAVLDTVARFLPEQLGVPSEERGSRQKPAPRPAPPPAASDFQPGDVVRFRHKSFGTEMLGRVVSVRKHNRLVLRPTAMRWGPDWQKILYTRTVVLAATNVTRFSPDTSGGSGIRSARTSPPRAR
jgi:hypothetical protein